MKKALTFIAFISILFSSIAFAHKSDDSACGAVAKACKSAGFERKNEEKRFWKDCMKPLLLGKSVKDVKIEADQVKNCRANKIVDLQKELKELQAVKE